VTFGSSINVNAFKTALANLPEALQLTVTPSTALKGQEKAGTTLATDWEQMKKQTTGYRLQHRG